MPLSPFICAAGVIRTALPHPSRRYLSCPPSTRQAVLPFPFIEDTCSCLHLSEVGLSGVEFLHPNTLSRFHAPSV